MKKIMFALAALAAVSCGTQRRSAADNASSDNADTKGLVTTLPAKSPKPVNVGEAGGRTAFALSLFNAALAENEDASANVIVSPYSAGMALSMLADGAEGVTKSELAAALCGTSYAGDVLKTEKDYTVSSANSIWLRNGFSINPGYRKNMESAYGAEVAERDFSKSSTVKEINKWCSDRTAGRIPEIIDEISPEMMMYIINALYFKAPWQYQFDKNSTFPEVFHSPAGDSKVDFMHISENFLCGEVDGNKFAVLPYKSFDYKMVLFLPAENADLNTLMPEISASVMSEALKNASGKKVALSMPKFKVNTTSILNGVLGRMGVHKVFAPGAELGGITSASVAVSQVLQKCFVEVNEEGSEAAAVTSAGIRMTSARPAERPFIMKLDRPFVFAIMDASTDDILFAGRISTIRQ